MSATISSKPSYYLFLLLPCNLLCATQTVYTLAMPELFGILVASTYAIATVAAAINPNPTQVWAQASARQRGWSNRAIVLTRSTQFLTLYAKLWLAAAIFSGDGRVARVALGLGTTVMILYYGSLAIDRGLLVHVENAEIAKHVTGLFPPRDILLAIVWVGLHFQHLICPTYLRFRPDLLEGGVGDGTPWDSVLAFLAYLGWNHMCWMVQGLPAYPVQGIAHSAGVYWPCVIICTGLVAIGSLTSYY